MFLFVRSSITKKDIKMNTETINTRFGTFEVIHSEEPTAPGYQPEYMVELKFNGTYLGHTIIVGDPRDIGSEAIAKIFNNNQERSEVAVRLG